jgi:hypothetical protein
MMRRIHERRGTTFGSVNERGDTEPDRLACLSLPELEQVVVFEIDRYNHSAHDGVGDRREDPRNPTIVSKVPLDRYLAYFRRPDSCGHSRSPTAWMPAGNAGLC